MSYENDHWIQVDIKYLEDLYGCIMHSCISDEQKEQLLKMIDYGNRTNKRFNRKCKNCELMQFKTIIEDFE